VDEGLLGRSEMLLALGQVRSTVGERRDSPSSFAVDVLTEFERTWETSRSRKGGRHRADDTPQSEFGLDD